MCYLIKDIEEYKTPVPQVMNIIGQTSDVTPPSRSHHESLWTEIPY